MICAGCGHSSDRHTEFSADYNRPCMNAGGGCGCRGFRHLTVSDAEDAIRFLLALEIVPLADNDKLDRIHEIERRWWPDRFDLIVEP